VAAQGDRQLLSLLVERDMDGLGGRCVLELSGAGFAPVISGDAVKVKLDVGDGMTPVFSGEANDFAVAATGHRVAARDDIAMLAAFDQEGAFENQTADAIIKTLITSAGARPGIIAKGPSLPSYVVHRGPRTLRHVQRLAELCGADLYTDADGRVQCAAPKNGSPDHTFRYGTNVLRLDLRAAAICGDSIEVWGEGAASAKGADKAHWLPAKLDGVSGTATLQSDGNVAADRLGKRPVRVIDGALRSGEAAKQVAEARMKNLAARRVRGFIEVFGAPKVKLGDLVSIDDLPDEHAAAALLDTGPLQVRGVRHTLDRSRGLVTRIRI
jgi:hypothetical protein